MAAVCVGNLKEFQDYSNEVPPYAQDDPQNIANRQMENMLLEVDNRRATGEAWLAQQEELDRPRLVVDHRAVLNNNLDRVRRAQGQGIPTVKYFQPYDVEEDMGYIEPVKIGAIIFSALPPM